MTRHEMPFKSGKKQRKATSQNRKITAGGVMQSRGRMIASSVAVARHLSFYFVLVLSHFTAVSSEFCDCSKNST